MRAIGRAFDLSLPPRVADGARPFENDAFDDDDDHEGIDVCA